MKRSLKGGESLQAFIKEIKRLVIVENFKFDLLICSGDSGRSLLEITRLTYIKLNQVIPVRLEIPYFRYEPGSLKKPFENNEVMIPEIIEVIKDVNPIRGILFVDDEIGTGKTLQGTISLLCASRPELSNQIVKITVVAENHDFNPDKIEGSIEINFRSIGNKKAGVNNSISKYLPQADINVINEKFPGGEINSKVVMNSLLGLGSKMLYRGKPTWSDGYLEMLSAKIDDFSERQNSYREIIELEIKKSLKED